MQHRSSTDLAVQAARFIVHPDLFNFTCHIVLFEFYTNVSEFKFRHARSFFFYNKMRQSTNITFDTFGTFRLLYQYLFIVRSGKVFRNVNITIKTLSVARFDLQSSLSDCDVI